MKSKRILSLCLAAAMIFGSTAMLPENTFSESTNISASAAGTATSGKCGKNVSWSLKNGVLTISGKGDMYDYEDENKDDLKLEYNSPFYNNEKIKSVVIQSGVTSIGNGSFCGCYYLESVTIPQGVTKIGDDVFNYCSLKNVTLPKGVKSIGYNAFYSCGKLKSVNMPSSVTSIGEGAFEDCSSLTSVNIPSGVTRISEYTFWNCTSLKSVTIPNSVTSIDSFAFRRTGLTSISIPSSITSIGPFAFSECKNLKSVIIPKSVKDIGNGAFGYYKNKNQDVRIAGFTIYGVKGTVAETYAKENKFKFVAIFDVSRLAGANRYGTAADISNKMYKKSDTVIVATGLTFHDALVAVPLANAYDAPLLLATENHITDQTEAGLKRLKAKNVIVVSTNGAIGAKAKAEFKAAKYNMTYIEGKTCFETAAKVAKALQTKTKKAPTAIFFATDSSFADALSASPVAAIKGAPIIYLNNKSIDKATADYLKSVKGKVKNAYIIGGSGVISDAMMSSVAKALGLTVNKTVVRVYGKNRYETCTAVNNKFKSVLTGDGICVAKGLDFPDALAGGVYAAATKQALFLADGKKLQDCQNTYLKSKNAGKITVFGGTGAVPDELVKTIAQASV